MAPRLVPCPRCARHVFAREHACPFCAFAPPRAFAGNGAGAAAAAVTLATSFALASCGDRTGLEVGNVHDAAIDAVQDSGAVTDASDPHDAARDSAPDVIGFDASPIPIDSGEDSGPIPIYGAPPPPGGSRAGRTPEE